MPVADPVDLVAVPLRGLRCVPVQREVALDEDLVGLPGFRWQVIPDLAEHQVEVAVSPEVVAGELFPEHLPEGGAEIAQLVGRSQ